MTEEKNEITLDGLKAMMKEAEAYENALENGEISPEQAIDNLFKKYPIKINSNILNQIKEHTLKRVRLFFIVGKNTNLAETVATCIFTAYKWAYDPAVIEIPLDTEENNYIRTEMTFKKHSYIGWDNTEIKEHLFLSKEPLINHFKKDNMLFLRGINDTKILERLADTVTVEIWRHGVLVINVPSMDILPQELLDQFDPIYLEPDKQNIPQERTESDTFNWSINSDKSEIYCNGKFVAKLPGILFKIFKCLQEKKGKFVKNKTLEKCWDKEPSYENYLVDTMNELETKLKNGLKKLEGINVQGKIIESKKTDKRKITAYKLPI